MFIQARFQFYFSIPLSPTAFFGKKGGGLKVKFHYYERPTNGTFFSSVFLKENEDSGGQQQRGVTKNGATWARNWNKNKKWKEISYQSNCKFWRAIFLSEWVSKCNSRHLPYPHIWDFFCFEVKTSEDDERCGFRVWSWFLLRFTPMIAWIQHHKFPYLVVIFSGLSSINKSFKKKIIVTNLFVLRRDA